ncbi:MAG TPA: hypothetical protein PKH07_01400 [bacterium]|nr:hypothetical protein [bacterium]
MKRLAMCWDYFPVFAALMLFASSGQSQEAKMKAVVLDRFNGETLWSVADAEQSQGTGRIETTKWGSILSYDFAKETTRVGIAVERLVVPGRPEDFEIQTYGDLKGHSLVLRLSDARGHRFEKHLVSCDDLLSTGARNHVVAWDGGRDWVHFSDLLDVTPILPISVSEIVLEASRGASLQGSVSLLQLAAHTWATDSECVRVSFPQTKHRGLFLLNSFSSFFPFQIPIRVENLSSEAYRAEATIQILDGDGFAVGSVEWPIEVPGLGEYDDPIELEPDRLGFFSLVLSGVGAVPVRKDFVLSRESSSQSRSSSFFGVNIGLTSLESPRERRFAASRAAQAGVSWTRETFHEVSPEAERGFLDLQRYDDSIDIAEREGIHVVGELVYGVSPLSPFAVEDAEVSDFERWRRWVSAVVTQYQEDIKYWEIWCSSERVVASSDALLFYEHLKQAHETIKATDPEEYVVGAFLTSAGLEFLESLLLAGGGAYWDVLSVIADPQDVGDASLPEQIAGVRALLQKHGCTKPLWVTCSSTMDNSVQDGMAPRLQAESLARMYLHCSSIEGVQKVFWNRFRDIDAESGVQGVTSGLLRSDSVPKPAFLALKTVAEHLAGSVFEATVALGLESDVHALSYLQDNSRILAVWSEGDPLNIAMAVGSVPVTVCDLWGHRTRLASHKGCILLPVTRSPLFLRFVPPISFSSDMVHSLKQYPLSLTQGQETQISMELPLLPDGKWEGAASVEATDGLLVNSPASSLELRENLSKTIVSATIQVQPGCRIGDHLIHWEFRSAHLPFGWTLQQVSVTPDESEAAP